MEPLLTAVTDSVATGYQALEHVIAGLRESLRLQAGAPARAPAGAARPAAAFQPRRGVSPAVFGQRDTFRPAAMSSSRHRSHSGSTAGAANPAGLVQDVAALVAEALGVAGTLVQDVAQAIAEQTHESGGQECLPTLALCTAADGTATTSFTVWNTGPTLLTDVQLSATDLIGGSLRSPGNSVKFAPASIARIAPGKGESVELSVSVPRDAAPDLCRGVVVATPGDASALIELTVTGAPQPVAVPPTEPAAPALMPTEPAAPDLEPS
jgi:hypothetical protein